jgi:predicted Ser/Thr protein kinase
MLEWPKENPNVETSRHELLSFEEYGKKVEENPVAACRPTYLYMLDMLKHFGKTEEGDYKLFDMDHLNSPAVYGQHGVQKSLIQNLINFEEEGFNNKFILLVGPNGSSKSSIVKKLISGLEEYSNTDEGTLFTFSWVFPIEQYTKGSLGLKSEKVHSNLNTYAHLEDKDILAIMNSDLKDHPLLLIPIEERKEVLNKLLEDHPKALDSVQKSYLYNGDLSTRNKMIYDALLKNYKGSHQEVLKHIRIERFEISRRYSTSAITIEPQMHVDAQMQQITMDRRLASLPPSLQSLNLFSMKGEVVLANRGILEFSDLLKRPLDTFKYLLMTMETRNINLHGILTDLDIFFVGTSNEVHLAAFKQHPDFNSFKGRFNFIRVPYLLNYKEETQIYEKQVEWIKDKTIFEPHALKALCLFSVMTRLRYPQVKNYPDKTLANITTNLTPLEKAILLAEKIAPERLDSESQNILISNIGKVQSEFEYENMYEGKFGISPRDIKKVIYKLASLYKNITFIEIIEYLNKLITKKNDFDFLNMTPQADYHHPARFIALIKDYFLDGFEKELRTSLGLVDARSYEDYIKRYIENVKALVKGEKKKNEITGKFEEHDDYFIKEFENSINLKEDPMKFRSHLLSKMGAYSLDNPGKAINYTEVFPNLVDRLQQSFRDEQKKVIQNISKNIVFLEAKFTENGGEKSLNHHLSKEQLEQFEKTISNLTENFGYSELGALSLIKFLIKERY